MVEKGGAKSQETRAKILLAARQVMAQKGFTGATTKAIAKAAGVAEGTIFRYFKTKKDLLLNLIPPEILENLSTMIESNEKVWDEDFYAHLIRDRLQLIKENLDIMKIFLYESQFHPELKDLLIENIVLKAAWLMENYFQRKIDQGEFRPVDPKIAVRALAGMVAIFVLWKEFLKADKYFSFDEEELVPQIVDIFLHGVKK